MCAIRPEGSDTSISAREPVPAGPPRPILTTGRPAGTPGGTAGTSGSTPDGAPGSTPADALGSTAGGTAPGDTTGIMADHTVTAVIELLRSRGAHLIEHPGGTLLEHLRRVSALLDRWGVRPAVRLAGLSHAYYGTDGFPTSLGAVERRDELAAVVGTEVEEMVYLYAGCDRAFSYPNLVEPEGGFRDRFTGAVLHPSLRWRRDFAELTVANELDVVGANPGLRAQYGKKLFELFLRWRPLLGDAAWTAVRTSLP
jgi:hypothetical protein